VPSPWDRATRLRTLLQDPCVARGSQEYGPVPPTRLPPAEGETAADSRSREQARHKKEEYWRMRLAARRWQCARQFGRAVWFVARGARGLITEPRLYLGAVSAFARYSRGTRNKQFRAADSPRGRPVPRRKAPPPVFLPLTWRTPREQSHERVSSGRRDQADPWTSTPAARGAGRMRCGRIGAPETYGAIRRRA